MYGFILQWMCGFASAFSPSSTVTKELLEREPDCLWDRFTNGSGVSPPQKYWWAWWAAVPHTGTAPWLTSSAKWQNFQERSEKLTWGLLFLINASDRWHTIRSHNSWDFPILRDMSTSRTQTSARFPPEELPPTINGNLKQNQGPNPPPPAKHSTQPALPAPWWQAASSFCNALQSGSGSLSSSSHFCMNEKGPSSSALLQLSAPTLWRQSFPSNRTVTLKITQTVLGDTW